MVDMIDMIRRLNNNCTLFAFVMVTTSLLQYLTKTEDQFFPYLRMANC